MTNASINLIYRDKRLFNVDAINNYYDTIKDEEKFLYLEIPNTVGITSDMIKKLRPGIRITITGPYDETKLQVFRYKNFKQYVTYSRKELIRILEEIEHIEHGINPSWSDIQKVVYICEYLKRNVIYDSEYKSKTSFETRTLRGLVTKNTVCAGYSLMVKELLDRQNIKSYYVGGKTITGSLFHNHAWNIFEIDGNLYPLDLTWDSSSYRSGKDTNNSYIGLNDAAFRKSHHPGPWEEFQNYEIELSSIDRKNIEEIKNSVTQSKGYDSTTYTFKRKNGTRFLLSFLGPVTFYNRTYYKYYYVDLEGNKMVGEPLVLYSDNNLSKYYKDKYYNGNCDYELEYAFIEKLFSFENLNHSLSENSSYIGGIKKNPSNTKLKKIVDKLQNKEPKDAYLINKDNEHMNLFFFKHSMFIREDGSMVLVVPQLASPITVAGVPLWNYEIYEYGVQGLKVYSIWTESYLRRFSNNSLLCNLFSKENIDTAIKEWSGYIGFLTNNATIGFNPKVAMEMKRNCRVELVKLSYDFGTLSETEFFDFNNAINIIETKKSSIFSDVDMDKAIAMVSCDYICKVLDNIGVFDNHITNIYSENKAYRVRGYLRQIYYSLKEKNQNEYVQLMDIVLSELVNSKKLK